MRYIIFLIAISSILVSCNRTPNFINGEIAPDFESTMPNGQTIKLSDFKGQYVLLDFWGSWCGPCRAENPNWVKLYAKYHGQQFKKGSDFTVLSIGIETKKNRWLAAIQKDNLTWSNHGSTLTRFKEPAAVLYNIKDIPTSYLINPDGMIMGVNLPAEQVDKLLAERLK